MGVIDCIGCKWCISVCPVGAIYVASVNDYYKNILLNDDECICCGACRNVCPTQDICSGLPPECRGSGGGGLVGGGEGDGEDNGGGDSGGGGGGGGGGKDNNDKNIIEIGEWAGEGLVAMTLAEQIAGCAKKQLLNNDRRYGSGADSLIDCSKLTQEIAANFNIQLPRTVSEQMQWFKDKNKFSSDPADIQEGDQLFYTNPNHTGIVIYLSGRLGIIHATINRNNPGCIKFNPIDSTGQIHNKSGSTTGFPNKFAGLGHY